MKNHHHHHLSSSSHSLRNHHPHASTSTIPYDDAEFDEEEDDEPNNNNPHPIPTYSHNPQFFYNYNYDDDDDDNNIIPNSKRHPKKRKLESFVSEFAPRPSADAWGEDESFVLLEVWGERYMELGRRSLRSEDWADVAEKVVEMSGIERTEAECRTHLDFLKNKYKKERAKVESGLGSKWVFFKKMDVLLNMRSRGHCGLGCGIDSGEYVFMNPRVYLERSNALDEMRDSPGQSDVEEDEVEEEGEEEEDGDEEGVDEESARMLAESIQRFGEIYERIEETKRKQVAELEKMRQDFQVELELQKKQIMERAQAEINKIREMDDGEDEDTDTSVENLED